MGRNKQPHYRVVVADSHSPRDGRIVENLGYYRPKATPARLVLDLARVDYWMARGAEPSDTVSSLVSKARRGGTASLAIGEPDIEAQRTRESEALAARRAAERKAREPEAKAPAAAEPDAEGAAEEPKPKKRGKKADAEGAADES
jgi:small subunit ribosomal protein S16